MSASRSPEGWTSAHFDDLFERRNGKASQIQTRDYRASGRFPVVDQGQRRIAAYSDREDLLFHTPEDGLVVFGDHTRIVKYVDFDFLVGADGTQLLAARAPHNARFLYYLLDFTEVPSGGYSRHIKFLLDARFSVPSPAEQEAIAEALADVDALIAALEQLISKKRDMKQGAMQHLLTGSTRLPGFTNRWRSCTLGNVLSVRHGKSQRGVEVPYGRYPILATGGEIGRASKPLYAKPSVLIGRKGTIDKPQYMDQPFWTVDTLFYTDVYDADVKYLFYLFHTIDWRSLNEASGVPSLNSARIEGIPVVLPDEDEQRAIANALSDIDAEIEALEARLAKTRDIKRGTMQKLLTGRGRLVTQGAAA